MCISVLLGRLNVFSLFSNFRYLPRLHSFVNRRPSTKYNEGCLCLGCECSSVLHIARCVPYLFSMRKTINLVRLVAERGGAEVTHRAGLSSMYYFFLVY